MSKLIQRIERLGRTAPAPMGFGALARPQASPAMVLIGATSDLGKLNDLGDSGLDAVLYRPPSGDAAAAGEAMETAGGLLWGVYSAAPTAEGLQALEEKGCDFVALDALTAPVEALHHEEMGHLLIVSFELGKEEARALEPLPLDAALLSEPLPSPLTLEHLLRLATLRGEIGLPFLLPIAAPPTAWEVECLREVGVEGLVPDLDRTTLEDLKSLAQAVRSMPRRRPRGERASPTLPQVRFALGSSGPEHDDDDGDEGEDDEDY